MSEHGDRGALAKLAARLRIGDAPVSVVQLVAELGVSLPPALDRSDPVVEGAPRVRDAGHLAEIEQAATLEPSGPGLGQVPLVRSHPGLAMAGAPGRIGRYSVRGELGAGGMGAVYDGWDPELCREVAIKVLHERREVDPDRLGRFVAEAQVTGQLDHPNIVPVHDLGVTDDGRLYFVMKKVQGRSLRSLVDGLAAGDAELNERWTEHRLLSGFVGLCHAVAYAHRRGVLHRDLKPSNVMVGPLGEIQLMDWGVARVLAAREERRGGQLAPHDADSSFTQEGQAIGTPGYMSPEQARGELDALSPRSDVWSLGAILYELLVFDRAYKANSALILLYAVVNGPPEAPSRRGGPRPVHPDLEAICLRALSTEAEDRYADAEALAEAVEEYLEGSKRREAERLLQRRRLLLAGAVGAALAVAVFVFASLWRQAVDARAEAQKTLGRLEVRTLLAEALDQKLDGHPAERLALLRAANELAVETGEATGSGAARQSLTMGLATTPGVRVVPLLDGEATRGSIAARPSPDGRRIALVVGDDRLRILGTAAGTPSEVDLPVGEARDVAWSPDGGSVAVVAGRSTVLFVRPGSGVEGRFDLDGRIDAVAWQGDVLWAATPGRLEVVGGAGVVEAAGVDRIWVRPDGLAFDSPPGLVDLQHEPRLDPDLRASVLAAEPGGDRAIVGLPGGRFALADLARGSVDRPLEGGIPLAVAPGGAILTLERSGLLRLSAPSGELLARSPFGLGDGQLGVAFSPDGHWLAGWSREVDAVRVLDARTLAPVVDLGGHGSQLAGLEWSSDDTLVTVDDAGELRLWTVGDTPLHAVYRDQGGEAPAGWTAGAWLGRMAVAPAGNALVAEAASGAIVWDAASGAVQGRIPRGDALIRDLVWAADGQSLEYMAGPYEVRGWRPGQVGTSSLLRLPGSGTALGRGPDGSRVVGFVDGTVGIWREGSAEPSVLGRPFDALGRRPSKALSWARDRSRFARQDGEGVARIWDATTGGELARFPLDRTSRAQLLLAPGGRLAAAKSRRIELLHIDEHERTRIELPEGVRVDALHWVSDEGRVAGTTDAGDLLLFGAGELVTIPAQRVELAARAFSPEGDLLATGYADGTVRLWSTRDGSLLGGLQAHAAAVSALAWGRDGAMIYTSSQDGTLRSWRADRLVARGDLMELAGRRTNLRVCRDDLTVVPVVHFPVSSTLWAPPESCPAAGAK